MRVQTQAVRTCVWQLLEPRHLRINVLRARLKLARWQSSSSQLSQPQKKLVLGCGSNTIDHIYHVKAVPTAGNKGFFRSPFKALEEKLVGGVTVNHLAWAALGGVSTGLMALQGEDELGRFMRDHLQELRVTTDLIQVDKDFVTTQCHVFIQEDGERSILMAPGSTSCIDQETVLKYFDRLIQEHASMVTTEISQVPVSGVMEILESARRANVLSVLDLDIPPSVAEKEANLGSVAEVVKCVKRADILKPAKAAAEELLAIMEGDHHRARTPKEIATGLAHLCDSKLVAITNGSQPCILATTNKVVEVSPVHVHNVLDTTGAGDAFLGGLVMGITKNGLPSSEEDLRNLGKIANAFGASCVQSVGGVPVSTSRETLKGYLSEADFLDPSIQTTTPQSSKIRDPPTQSAPSPSTRVSQFSESLMRDAQAAASLAAGLDMDSVERMVCALDKCEGQFLISGVGKSGFVGRRFAGSLGSIGLPAHFIHATEFVHGDLGVAQAGRDVVVFLSHSGNTEECVRAAYHLVSKGVCTMVITGGKNSKLSKLCTFDLTYNQDDFQEPFGCLPTTSIAVQEMLCNALLNQLLSRRGIGVDVYRQNHPGGSIGRTLGQN